MIDEAIAEMFFAELGCKKRNVTDLRWVPVVCLGEGRGRREFRECGTATYEKRHLGAEQIESREKKGGIGVVARVYDAAHQCTAWLRGRGGSGTRGRRVSFKLKRGSGKQMIGTHGGAPDYGIWRRGCGW